MEFLDAILFMPDNIQNQPVADPTMTFLQGLEDPAKYVRIQNVPIFVPHERQAKGKDGEDINITITMDDLGPIAEQINEREMSYGVPPVLTIGHRQQSNPNFPEQMQPPIVGCVRDAHVGAWGPQQKPAVLATMYYKKEDWEEAKKYPFRSVDFYPGSNKVTGVALLKRDPFLPMGIVSYAGTPNGERFGFRNIHDELPPAVDPFATKPFDDMAEHWGWDQATQDSMNGQLPPPKSTAGTKVLQKPAAKPTLQQRANTVPKMNFAAKCGATPYGPLPPQTGSLKPVARPIGTLQPGGRRETLPMEQWNSAGPVIRPVGVPGGGGTLRPGGKRVPVALSDASTISGNMTSPLTTKQGVPGSTGSLKPTGFKAKSAPAQYAPTDGPANVHKVANPTSVRAPKSGLVLNGYNFTHGMHIPPQYAKMMTPEQQTACGGSIQTPDNAYDPVEKFVKKEGKDATPQTPVSQGPAKYASFDGVLRGDKKSAGPAQYGPTWAGAGKLGKALLNSRASREALAGAGGGALFGGIGSAMSGGDPRDIIENATGGAVIGGLTGGITGGSQDIYHGVTKGMRQHKLNTMRSRVKDRVAARRATPAASAAAPAAAGWPKLNIDTNPGAQGGNPWTGSDDKSPVKYEEDLNNILGKHKMMSYGMLGGIGKSLLGAGKLAMKPGGISGGLKKVAASGALKKAATDAGGGAIAGGLQSAIAGGDMDDIWGGMGRGAVMETVTAPIGRGVAGKIAGKFGKPAAANVPTVNPVATGTPVKKTINPTNSASMGNTLFPSPPAAGTKPTPPVINSAEGSSTGENVGSIAGGLGASIVGGAAGLATGPGAVIVSPLAATTGGIIGSHVGGKIGKAFDKPKPVKMQAYGATRDALKTAVQSQTLRHGLIGAGAGALAGGAYGGIRNAVAGDDTVGNGVKKGALIGGIGGGLVGGISGYRQDMRGLHDNIKAKAKAFHKDLGKDERGNLDETVVGLINRMKDKFKRGGKPAKPPTAPPKPMGKFTREATILKKKGPPSGPPLQLQAGPAEYSRIGRGVIGAGVGSLVGAGIGAATAKEGERLEGAGKGAALGAAGGGGLGLGTKARGPKKYAGLLDEEGADKDPSKTGHATGFMNRWGRSGVMSGLGGLGGAALGAGGAALSGGNIGKGAALGAGIGSTVGSVGGFTGVGKKSLGFSKSAIPAQYGVGQALKTGLAAGAGGALGGGVNGAISGGFGGLVRGAVDPDDDGMLRRVVRGAGRGAVAGAATGGLTSGVLHGIPEYHGRQWTPERAGEVGLIAGHASSGAGLGAGLLTGKRNPEDIASEQDDLEKQKALALKKYNEINKVGRAKTIAKQVGFSAPKKPLPYGTSEREKPLEYKFGLRGLGGAALGTLAGGPLGGVAGGVAGASGLGEDTLGFKAAKGPKTYGAGNPFVASGLTGAAFGAGAGAITGSTAADVTRDEDDVSGRMKTMGKHMLVGGGIGAGMGLAAEAGHQEGLRRGAAFSSEPTRQTNQKWLDAMNHVQAEKARMAKIKVAPKVYPSLPPHKEPVMSQSAAMPVVYEVNRAPTGGADIAGKHFTGGQFIPSSVMEKATPEEKATLNKSKKTDPTKAKPSTKKGKPQKAGDAPEGNGDTLEKSVGLLDPKLKNQVTSFLSDAPPEVRQELIDHLNTTLTGKVGDFISHATPEELHELHRAVVAKTSDAEVTARAPKGGITIDGHAFPPGHIVPPSYAQKASPEEKKAIGFEPVQSRSSWKKKAVALAVTIGVALALRGAAKGMFGGPDSSDKGSDKTPPKTPPSESKSESKESASTPAGKPEPAYKDGIARNSNWKNEPGFHDDSDPAWGEVSSGPPSPAHRARKGYDPNKGFFAPGFRGEPSVASPPLLKVPKNLHLTKTAMKTKAGHKNDNKGFAGEYQNRETPVTVATWMGGDSISCPTLEQIQYAAEMFYEIGHRKKSVSHQVTLC